MKALMGTRRLFRLNLRLDRIKLPIWITANIGLLALTLPQLLMAYNTDVKRLGYAAATAPSAVTRLLGGALTGPSNGEISIIETYVLVTLLIVLMNIFLITRHTRQNEESNRSEMIDSTLVGRQASLTAALLLALAANVLTTMLIFAVYFLNDYPLAGSLAYSLSLGMTGLLFAGISAVCAQLFESTRTANGLAGLIFGVSFMIKGLGDAFGQLLPSGVGVKTNLLSWFSPLGWPTNMQPFADEKWWVLGLIGVFIIGSVSLAYFLLSKRDVGASLFAPKPGKQHAPAYLKKRLGLTWRLSRGATISWFIGLAISAAAFGGVANEFAKLIAENEEIQKILAALGSGMKPSDILFTATFMLLAIATSGYGLQVLAKMRAEEANGRLEAVLATPISRSSWLMDQVLYTLATIVVILLSSGLVAGIIFGIIDNSLTESVPRLVAAMLLQLPAILVVVSIGLVLFGLLPRLFNSLIWAILGACLLIFQLGAALDLPNWLINISPFTHTPVFLGQGMNWTPVFWLSSLALIFGLLAFALFKRRDIVGS